MMRRIFVFASLFFFANGLFGQSLRTSHFQYQYNQLALNPAYASRLPALGFDATYFGNFASANQVSRSVLLNIQGPTAAGGMGGTFQFYRTFFFGEMNIRPAYAYQLNFENGGKISFGANVSLNYFDIDETVLSSVQSDFFSIDGGVGVFYHHRRSFAGLSVLRLFEATFGLRDDGSGSQLLRENPFNFHAGTAFRLMDDIDLKPSLLLRYINVYELPDQSFGSLSHDFSFDFQLSAIVEDIYVISLLYGHTDKEFGIGLDRFGVSASYVLGNFRLGYAIQINSQGSTSVSLPASHLLNFGYEIFNGNEESPVRYF